MQRAHSRGAVVKGKFFFHRWVTAQRLLKEEQDNNNDNKINQKKCLGTLFARRRVFSVCRGNANPLRRDSKEKDTTRSPLAQGDIDGLSARRCKALRALGNSEESL